MKWQLRSRIVKDCTVAIRTYECHQVEERRERSRVHGGERARDRGEKLECHKQDLDHSCVMRVEGGMSRVGRRGYGLVNLQFDSFEFDFTIQMAK